MSIRVDQTSFAGTGIVVGGTGLGVKGAVIRAATATGTHGPGLLHDDLDSAADDTKEFRALINSWPASGTLKVNEPGDFELTGAADGAHTIGYRLDLDGVASGTTTETVYIGVLTASSDLVAAFAVQGVVQVDAPASYSVLGSLQLDLAASYALQGVVLADHQAAYAVVGALQADLLASYALAATVHADLPAAYAVVGGLQVDLAAAYAVRAAVQADLAAAFDVESAGQVSADLLVAYAIAGSAQRDLSASYGVMAAAAADLQGVYALQGAVQSDLVAAFDIEPGSQVQADFSAAWAVMGSVLASLVASYQVDGSVPQVVTGIPPRARVIAVRRVSRRIPVTTEPRTKMLPKFMNPGAELDWALDWRAPEEEGGPYLAEDDTVQSASWALEGSLLTKLGEELEGDQTQIKLRMSDTATPGTPGGVAICSIVTAKGLKDSRRIVFEVGAG